MPYVKRFERMVDIVSWLVKENVSYTAPEDDPQRRPDEKVVHVLTGDHLRRPCRERETITPPDQQTDNIGERIPANRKRGEGDCDRIESREWYCKDWH